MKTRTDPMADAEDVTTVKIVINGIAHRDGIMRVALFDSPDGFPGEMDTVYRRLETPIVDEPVTVTLEDVPAGRYAVSVFHDEDGDGVMETGLFGQPSEGYGISNDATALFGPPSFEDASFAVASEPVLIRITMNY